MYLSDELTRRLLKELDLFFESMVAVPRIRHGKHQTLETLIDEEAYLLAKYLRTEPKLWLPRSCNC